MYSIRQAELFSLHELLEMSPKDTYTLVFETLDIMTKPNQITIDYKENSNKDFPYTDQDKKISVSITGADQTPRETYVSGQVQLNGALYVRNNVAFTTDITLKNGTTVPTINAYAMDIGKDELKSFKAKGSGYYNLADIAKAEIKIVEISEYKSK
ncbi:hypothetical protein [Paenibacillus sp. N3.4]|uniref:hypothetical protein n=1 Tax=Paenibacillus sp. N3.4 TaxID=2603222 RepID=UPI0011C9A05B|nr:hypothetical protein [Paenibacillus sp. N3.4]TXK83595.1 hypothetical protein FU659_12690 [Paenibacillus sp. N3.4]